MSVVVSVVRDYRSRRLRNWRTATCWCATVLLITRRRLENVQQFPSLSGVHHYQVWINSNRSQVCVVYVQHHFLMPLQYAVCHKYNQLNHNYCCHLKTLCMWNVLFVEFLKKLCTYTCTHMYMYTAFLEIQQTRHFTYKAFSNDSNNFTVNARLLLCNVWLCLALKMSRSSVKLTFNVKY